MPSPQKTAPARATPSGDKRERIVATRARPKRPNMLSAIRAAAIVEFSLHGLNGTSTQAIAARAGLSKPRLHYYIDGKEEIYKEILLEMVRDWQILFAFRTPHDGPAAVLEDYIRKKLDNAFDHPEMSRIITREVLDGGQHLEWYWPNARSATQAKVDVIEGWIAKRLMRPLDARLLLQHIWAATQYHADYALESQAMLGPHAGAAAEREHVARELVALLLGGCGIRAVPARAPRAARRVKA